MERISRIAVERAMTIQEVILMAMARKLTWIEASQVLGYTERHMRRVKAKHKNKLPPNYKSLLVLQIIKLTARTLPFSTSIVESCFGLW